MPLAHLALILMAIAPVAFPPPAGAVQPAVSRPFAGDARTPAGAAIRGQPGDPRTEVGHWSWPVQPATVVHRFVPPTQPWARGHRGVDLAAVPSGSVVAPADGQVSFVGVIAGRPVLVLTHPGGLRSTLEPVRSTVTVGSPVARGHVVGAVEESVASHCAPAACVHWGVLRGSTYLDPASLVSGRVVLLPLSP